MGFSSGIVVGIIIGIGLTFGFLALVGYLNQQAENKKIKADRGNHSANRGY